jgi:hypothetical protein
MRRTQLVTISGDPESRDNGKTFLITEMPAQQGEDWAIRALLGLMNTGVDLPEGVLEQGMGGLATVGLSALGKLPWHVVKPLFDEMFTTIQIQMPNVPPRDLLEGDGADIEEIKTRVILRGAWFKLHVGFSKAALDKITAMRSKAATLLGGGLSTLTSDPSSAPSSPAA